VTRLSSGFEIYAVRADTSGFYSKVLLLNILAIAKKSLNLHLKMIQIAHILFDLGANGFLVPYLRQSLTPDYDPERPADDPEPTAAVRILHCDENRDADTVFSAKCGQNSLPAATLVCPNIIGTGMNGRMRRIAGGIYNGTYFHIRGSEGKTSVVHAVDVARAAVMAAGTTGRFTLTDGTTPSIRDVAEALAYRIDNKRLFTLPKWAARWWYSREFYGFLTSDTSETDTFAEAFPEFLPTDTLMYLHTHIYDDASL